MSKNTINSRLKDIIDELQLTQNQFARELKTSSSRISNIVSGRNKPDSDLLAAIVLNYPQFNARWLLTGQGLMLTHEQVGTSELKEEASNYNPPMTAEQEHTLRELEATVRELKAAIEQMNKRVSKIEQSSASTEEEE